MHLCDFFKALILAEALEDHFIQASGRVIGDMKDIVAWMIFHKHEADMKMTCS